MRVMKVQGGKEIGLSRGSVILRFGLDQREAKSDYAYLDLAPVQSLTKFDGARLGCRCK